MGGGGAFGFSKSDSEQSSDPRDVTPPELAQLRGPFANIIRSLFQAGGPVSDPLAGVPGYEGPLSSPMAAGEEQILNTLLAKGGGAGSDLLASTAAGAYVPQNGQLDPFTQAALDASIAPFQRQQEEFLSRQLPSAVLQAGQNITPGGSAAMSRFGMIQSADIAQRAAEVGAGLAFDQRENERGRQQEAIQLGQQEVQTLTQNLQAQALPRLIEELGIERGLAEFQNRMNALLQALAVVSGSPISQVGQVSRGESDSFAFDVAGGGGATGGGNYQSGVSDVRRKMDIEPLLELEPGIHVYSFRWRSNGMQAIGLLAQEVELRYPERVKEIPGGWKIVNYGAFHAS